MVAVTTFLLVGTLLTVTLVTLNPVIEPPPPPDTSFEDLQLDVTPSIQARVAFSNDPPESPFLDEPLKDATEDVIPEEGIQYDVSLPPPPPATAEADSPDWSQGIITASFSGAPGTTWTLTAAYPMVFVCSTDFDVLIPGEYEPGEPHEGQVSGQVTQCGRHVVSCVNYTQLVPPGPDDQYMISFAIDRAAPDANCTTVQKGAPKTGTKAKAQVAAKKPSKRPIADLIQPGRYELTTVDLRRPQKFATAKEAFQKGSVSADCNAKGGGRIWGCEKVEILESKIDYKGVVFAKRGWKAGEDIVCQPTGMNVEYVGGAIPVAARIRSVDIKGTPVFKGKSTASVVTFRTATNASLYPTTPKQQLGLDAHSDVTVKHENAHREHSRALVIGRGTDGGIKQAIEKWVLARVIKKLKNEYAYDNVKYKIRPPKNIGTAAEADVECRDNLRNITREAYDWAMGSQDDAFDNPGTAREKLKARAPRFTESVWGHWAWYSFYWDAREGGNVCFNASEAAPKGKPAAGECYDANLPGTDYVIDGSQGVYGDYWPYWGTKPQIKIDEFVTQANKWLVYVRAE